MSIALIMKVGQGDEGRERYEMVKHPALKGVKEAKKFLEDQNFVGTVFPVRMGKPITRSVKQVASFE